MYCTTLQLYIYKGQLETAHPAKSKEAHICIVHGYTESYVLA